MLGLVITIALTTTLLMERSAEADILAWWFTASDEGDHGCRLSMRGSTHGEPCLFDGIYGSNSWKCEETCALDTNPTWEDIGGDCDYDEWDIYHCGCEGTVSLPYACRDLAFSHICSGPDGWYGDLNNPAAGPSISLEATCSHLDDDGPGLAGSTFGSYFASGGCSLVGTREVDAGLAAVLLILLVASLLLAHRRRA